LFSTDLVGPDGTRGWDPTGLVKGWAVAGAADHLRGVDRIAFSLNAGGDIVCGLGRDAAGMAPAWRIGIQDPAEQSAIAGIVELVEGAVATSGNAARGHHIIDPRTGHHVERRESTTIIGPDLMWADVWATATFIEPAALHDQPGWADYRLILARCPAHGVLFCPHPTRLARR
jgi:thiamine biosynthesis lipoprotein